MEQHEIQNIIARIRSGDTNAFRVLINAHKNMVFALCNKMATSPEDAEDIAQEAFIKAYKSLGRFKGKSKFSTWLYQITYFTAVDHLRKQKLPMAETTSYEPSNEKNESFDRIQEQDRQHYLNKALTLLSPQERAIITLFYLDEHSMEEIAQITRLSVSNTKVKIHRTRKKLNGILNHLLKNEVHSLL